MRRIIHGARRIPKYRLLLDAPGAINHSKLIRWEGWPLGVMKKAKAISIRLQHVAQICRSAAYLERMVSSEITRLIIPQCTETCNEASIIVLVAIESSSSCAETLIQEFYELNTDLLSQISDRSTNDKIISSTSSLTVDPKVSTTTLVDPIQTNASTSSEVAVGANQAVMKKYFLNDSVTSAEILWALETVATHGSYRSAGTSVALFQDVS